MSPARSGGPLRVAIANDYDIVIAGVEGLLVPFADRVTVVERDAQVQVDTDVDVVLWDSFGQREDADLDVAGLVPGAGARAKVVVFSWNTDSGVVDRALDRGAAGYIAKSAAGAELVEAIERVAAGERVVPERTAGTSGVGTGRWPGEDRGLSSRESEVVALITQGLSNQEIADTCYLSINSVKTYIRTAYRKMGVSRRSQAVLWGLDHGFSPDRARHRTVPG